MIRFSCPSCSQVFDRSDKDAGAKFVCTHCGQKVQVPPIPLTSVPRQRGNLVKWILATSALMLLLAASVAIIPLWRHFAKVPGSDKSEIPEPGKSASNKGDSGGNTALAILKANCYRCHGENGSAEGGFNYVLDRDKLVVRKRIVLGEPEKSKLFRRVLDGEMPPESEKPRPSEGDIEAIRKWIAAGAPSSSPSIPPSEFVSDLQVVKLIHADLVGLPERDRRFARYFTFTNLHNIGLTTDEIKTYQHGLAKLVNSLSWNRQIKEPQSIDQADTVFRIDIRDYQWSERVWSRILSEYPYAIALNDPIAREIQEMTAGQFSHVRGDWFVATASHPPLYHEVLQLPTAERKLEEQLHIDVLENIRQERVLRAGFNGSGVSRNNRLIERHESPYGSYWRSYDFGSNVGARNIFAHPLGPAGKNGFSADGGEIIFSLPNGLHAFMLVNEKGERLDKAPISIVSDPRRPDRSVENGVSCMSCHVRGLLLKQDQVRPHVQKNQAAFTQDEIETVKATYPSDDRLQEAIRRDNDRFRKAIEATGSNFSLTEPITALVTSYEKELDLAVAASEAGLEPKEFSTRLGESTALTRQLGALRAGGSVQRQVFIAAFPLVVEEFKLGVHQRFK